MQSQNLRKISPSFPSDFDPSRFPIIAAHFFGLVALPSLDATGSDNKAVNIDDVAS